MNKNNDVMICINDLYFEDTEDMRKLSEYVLQLERKKFFYEKGYRKVLMIKNLCFLSSVISGQNLSSISFTSFNERP